MTLYEKFKTMSIEEMASYLSELYHSADYEDDDYDPDIMQMLISQVEEGAEDGSSKDE